MGSYAECWLGSFYVGATKDEFDPSIMQLFRSSDKKVVFGTKKEVPVQLHRWSEYVEDNETIHIVYYSAPVNVIRDRLDLKGYSLENCKVAFMDWVNREIEQLEGWSQRSHGEVFAEKISFLKMMAVEEWLGSLEKIYSQKLGRRQNQNKTDTFDGTLIGFMLDSSNDWYGYPGLDLSIALRLAIEILPETENFIYDFTDLVLSGYYSHDDDLVKLATDWLSGIYSSTGKTIVLTEGGIDSWIISETLQLLYPHLSDYFTFMDFEGARVGGGAGSLANMVKAFSGTGIVNKVVAFFDNDTAATTALRGLKLVQIPPNIKIIQLPKIELLENYPTIGPSGLFTMDVSGLAASIELYLGKDVLTDSQGNLVPIQWTGYVPELGRYQGEIVLKEETQKRFKQKLIDCKANNELLRTTDWSGLQAILQSLFTAFHELDQKDIRSFATEVY